MAKKAKPSSPFEGRWRIVSMETWDQGFVDAEVEGGRGVPDPHLGRVGRRNAVDRASLRKPGQQRGLLPLRFVKGAVDHHLAREVRRLDHDLSGPPGVDTRHLAVREEPFANLPTQLCLGGIQKVARRRASARSRDCSARPNAQ